MGSLCFGNPLKQHVHLLPSSSISLTEKTCFYTLSPCGFVQGQNTNKQSCFPFHTPHTRSSLTELPSYSLHASATLSLVFSHLHAIALHLHLLYSFHLSHCCNLRYSLSSAWFSQQKSLSPTEMIVSLHHVHQHPIVLKKKPF